MKRLVLVVSVLSFLLLPSPATAEGPSWKPSDTWVMAVGILKFKNKDLGTWPDEGRKDQVMMDAYRKRGVPESQTLFLKNEEATRVAIVRELVDMLKKTKEGQTFIFYYAGHGSRDYGSPGRECYFVAYDSMPDDDASYLPFTEVFDLIEKHFQGKQAILMSDCCHSGGLAVEARKRKDSRISYGVLTSAHVSSKSTGNWTFTDVVIEMLTGDARVDADENGAITFEEAALYLEEEMAFAEEQFSQWATTGNFAAETVISTASGRLPDRVGERLEAKSEGKWYKVEIIDAADGKYKVHWIGYDPKWDSWVTPDQMRPYRPKTHPEGKKVKVSWNGTWYDAVIVKTKRGLHFVHYEGFTHKDDEWVPRNRIKLKE